MRKAFFKEINGSFKYDFGADTFIICAVMKLPNVKGDGISFEIELSGGELIAFIREFAPTHLEVIPSIIEGHRYILSAWDW